ncbi:putative ovochymase-2-like [Scophthalmus maximus]|uniref:Putative ovochymase-2-like n=1 Tax=Scophthalmus maximus TaxID=52904 RepID=A0A2U9BXD4_SCOMX|nr:putative ovochymase-2-like [Scophthalmus maximus]
MRATAALLSLCLWVNAVVLAAQTGSKCGVPQVWSPMPRSLRVVGGSEAAYGSHPWLVSLRLKGSHFCGGAVLTDRWVLTAAHCFASASREFLSGVTVAAGEFDQRVADEEEQVFGVKSVSVHEKYHHASPMSHDVALVELDRRVRLGVHVQPICLPLPDEKILPRTSCIVGGWGRIKERGRLPAVLRQVQLDLVDPAKCKHVLHTVKGSGPKHGAVRPEAAMTVLCAGPERGGRDACQGDSGGPLVCPAGSGGGRRVALGVTSWGKGCGRSWGNNSVRPPGRRGSPGVFTDLRLLLPWIKSKLRAGEKRLMRHVMKQKLLHHGKSDEQRRGKASLGTFCGSVLRGPVLLSHSPNATLLFSSDVSTTGSGFVIRHRAAQGRPDPGCGTIVLVEDQTVVHSPNYPQSYSNDCVLRWVIYAPRGHVVKLDVSDLDLEESDRCLYDSLTVLGDVEQTEEIAVLCGRGAPPPPVLSYHNVMVLQFTSDGSVTRTFCGSVLRGPVLLSHSPNATLLFSSDVSTTGSGFVIRHRAAQGRPDPGCGTIVLVEDQTVVHSPNYPQSYSNDCVLRWVIYAPRGHVVKLDVSDLDLEESDRCLYDSLTVLGDVEQTEEIAVLCGRGAPPPPVLSYHNVMVLQFTSDGSVTRRGFRATLTTLATTDRVTETFGGITQIV